MTHESPERVRVPVAEPTPEPDPARTGCLWIGGVLGVIAGIVVTFFAVPSILNFLFPSETIAVGETFQDDKLTMRVEEVVLVELEIDPGGRAAYLVRWEVTARSSWSARYDSFVMVLDDETELPGTTVWVPHGQDKPPTTFTVPQGTSTLEVAFFDLERIQLPAPDSVHLEEPPVKFKLPEPTSP